MTTPFLTVTDVRRSYGRFTALHGVNLLVEQGELFGLLGPNGAGKTTLLSILACLHDADSGEVRLEGELVSTSNRDLRRKIGIATQDLAIYKELSAAENLAFFGRLYGLYGQELRERVREVLALCGLADRGDQRAGTMSGGMQRRLNLGVAIMHRPKLLFLDEPTTGVDPQSRNHIFGQVQELNAAGMTIIYTSHYMEEVQTLCKRIGIIELGRMIACDTLPGLLRLLDSTIRLRVGSVPTGLLERLNAIPDGKVSTVAEGEFLIACRDLSATVVRVIGILQELSVELRGLETQEPNLERVFLHLTGHALRD